MFAWNTRRARRVGRDRFRPGQSASLVAVERLEARQLLAFNVTGQSLPDLVISGFASTAAAWGGPITVTLNVRNLGASTIIEPLALDANAASSADAPPSVVAVYAVHNPHNFRGAVEVGTVTLPTIRQNSFLQQTSTFNLPPKPFGFPGNGGKIYLVFQANATGTVFESDTSNDTSKPVPVLIEAPLPDLEAVGLALPPVMQPGDVVQANVRIANFGPGDTGAQGPVTVDLVASSTPHFVLGKSKVIAEITLANIPGIQNTATLGPIFADSNQTPQQNVVTAAFPPARLPSLPAKYYIGVVIDPLNQIKQLNNLLVGGRRKESFSLVQRVGPPIYGLPPAGQIVAGGATNVPVFPFPFGGVLVGGALDGTSFPAAYPPVALGAPTTTGIITAASITPQIQAGGTLTDGAISARGATLFPTGVRGSTLSRSVPNGISTSRLAGAGLARGRQVTANLRSGIGGSSASTGLV